MNICLYGGAGTTLDAVYVEATEKLGRCLAKRGHGLVFGGGANGMMGAAARGAFAENGTIIGVVPSFFNVDGVLFNPCTEMIYTETMRERKRIMEQRSDAFVMTPGGIGTLDEFFEIITLRSLKQHPKPIAVYNVNGYFDGLLDFLEQAKRERFIGSDTLPFAVYEQAESLLDFLEQNVVAHI